LPRAHLDPRDPRRRPVTIDPALLPRSARLLSRFLRGEAARLDGEGIGWQCLIDALRPHTTAIWGGLPLEERARFLRKLSRYWEVVRHRASAEALESIAAWRRAGKLEILAGNVGAAEALEHGLEVRLDLRDGGSAVRRFDRIVLCTGPQTDVRRWRGLLFRNLLREGAIEADPLGLGIVTDAEGRVIGGDGHASSWLYTIGGLRRSRLWETTAVPDIVRQADALAELIGDN
jgi:uncharacterized NAD(P)/FAD-binding protein YdhS